MGREKQEIFQYLVLKILETESSQNELYGKIRNGLDNIRKNLETGKSLLK